MWRLILQTCVFAAIFGYGIGSAHSELYALRNVVKFPLMILSTATICSISHYLWALALCGPIPFARVQRLSFRFFRDATMLLASLAPVTIFLGHAVRATDDGRLGEYDAYLALHLAVVAATGSLALVRQSLELFAELRLTRRSAVLLTLAWLSTSLTVGGQVAFQMRPFFGFPATRGFEPPGFLGSEPDLRGAKNFFEVVWQVLSSSPLSLE